MNKYNSISRNSVLKKRIELYIQVTKYKQIFFHCVQQKSKENCWIGFMSFSKINIGNALLLIQWTMHKNIPQTPFDLKLN